MSEYTDTYLVLDCSVYPKAYIRIYRTYKLYLLSGKLDTKHLSSFMDNI